MSGNLSVQGSGNKLIGTFKPIAKTLTGNITGLYLLPPICGKENINVYFEIKVYYKPLKYIFYKYKRIF